MSRVKDLLGDRPFGTEPHKLVRREGPDTSRRAAQAIDSASLEGQVYTVIKDAGPNGCTSDEVREQFPVNLPYSSVTARYKALIEKGYIADTGERRRGKSGSMMRVMRAIR